MIYTPYITRSAGAGPGPVLPLHRDNQAVTGEV